MGLFQKKPQIQSSAPLYTLGTNRTVLIIGLGNPGKDYDGSRHNIGFAVLDEFAKQNNFPDWVTKKDLKCQLAINNMGQTRVILCRPATFMNDSGQAAQAVQRFYRVYNQDTLAVYDELAIPFGSLRTRLGGSDAGHNGVKSLIQHIGDDFGRLRIGIGSATAKKTDAANFVLAKFSKAETNKLPLVIREADSIITEHVFGEEISVETRTVF
jgi:peptidyl-tRNA hydrolase, PTH1 family